MTEVVENQQDQKKDVSDKEINFRALEAKYEQKLANERLERQKEKEEFNKRFEELQRKESVPEDNDDDDEYIDKRKLTRQFTDFEKKLDTKIDTAAEKKARMMLQERDKERWQKENDDFYQVLEKHADEFQKQYPHLAQSILNVADPFERQRMAYENIKALGLNKPKESIQDTVNQKQQSPYYQPTNIGNSPYSNTSGDYSPAGRKNAYEQMKALQQKLRI